MKVLIQKSSADGTSFLFKNYRAEVSLTEEEAPFKHLESIKILGEAGKDDLSLPVMHTGYFDAHLHAMWMAELCGTLNASDYICSSDFLKRIKKQETKDFLYIHSWDEFAWGYSLQEIELFFKTTFKEFENVLCLRKCGHCAFVKTSVKAFEGKSNRLLNDEDLSQIIESFPKASAEKYKKGFLKVQEEFLSQGLVAIGDMSLNPQMLQAYEELINENQLKLNVWGVVDYDDSKDFLERGPYKKTSEKGYSFELKYIKHYLDGSLGASTALLSENYQDSSQKGLSLISNEELLRRAKIILEKGFLLSFHAIGDAALDQILWLGKELGLTRTKAPGHRIEHVQVMRKDQWQELKKQGWFVFLQPAHRHEDSSFLVQRLGSKRSHENAHLLASFLREKIPTALSSDAPISSYKPLYLLKACLNDARKEEALSFWKALYMYTKGNYQLVGSQEAELKAGDRVFLTEPF